LGGLVGIVGIVVHDHWKPCYTLESVQHALCNAHPLRELQALIDIEREPWALRMQRLLRRACHVSHLVRERDGPVMGAIAEATGNHPQALELFRRILLASAAIPGEFPPVMFDVPQRRSVLFSVRLSKGNRPMEAITYTYARQHLAEVMRRANDDHAPVVVTSQRGKPVVILSLDDYHAMEETAYLLRHPKGAQRLLEAVGELRSGGGLVKELVADD
jgi:antitoxin YefM